MELSLRGVGVYPAAARKKMTIDQRLEALTRSLESLASLHKDNEKGMAEMRHAIERLANIAHAHNEQLDGHETRIDRLENQ
jgi:chromosome segregation ATPase